MQPSKYSSTKQISIIGERNSRNHDATLISLLTVTVFMKIGIVGGTGGMGEGFALRWCQKHDVIVGSSDAQKARDAADNYSRAAKQA